MNTSWTKSGRRSAKHKGYPRMVVRFDSQGRGKGKLLCDVEEFQRRELENKRVPENTIATLVKDAEAAWPELVKQEQDAALNKEF